MWDLGNSGPKSVQVSDVYNFSREAIPEYDCSGEKRIFVEVSRCMNLIEMKVVVSGRGPNWDSKMRWHLDDHELVNNFIEEDNP